MPSLQRRTSQPTGERVSRLPDTAFTKGKILYRPVDDVWSWTDGPFRLHIDFGVVDGQFAALREPLKACLLVYTAGYSCHYVQNLFGAFRHFMSTRNTAQPFSSFSVAEVSNYAARLKPHEAWRLSTLNVLLQKWSALRLPGVDDACAEYLRERRKPGNEKGKAVRTRDPVSGPFSEAEYTALYKAVDTAYGTGALPLWAAVLTRLLFACGGRISQYASLKLSDLTSPQGSFVLRLPQVKKGEVNARMSFRNFDLSPQTGRLVQELVDQMLSEGQGIEAPLLHERLVMKRGLQETRRSSEDPFYGHCTAQNLAKVLMTELEAIAPPTERLDFAPIPVSTRRFRYTFGTRMAEEGMSKAVIADRLGHADLQNVDVYFEASPKIIENIDRAMGAMLAPLASAFRGRLIEGEEDSTAKGAPGSRIIDFRVSNAAVGSCGGSGKGCRFNKPVACYTCFRFEPWLDAPHEKVLARLEEERRKHGADERVARANDDAIRAVHEVMAECAQAQAQREEAVVR